MISSDKDRSNESDENEQLSELRKTPTPIQTDQNFKSSTSKTRQSIDEIQQVQMNKEYQGSIQEPQNEGEITENEKKTQNSYYSSSKSSKTSYAMKISLMQASINAKDQLISELKDEIQLLKKKQQEKDTSMVELKNIYEQRFQSMNKHISQLENQIKDVEQQKNINQTLNFSQISQVPTKVDKKKSDQKEQEYTQQEQDLHSLGANFWILQAEKEITNQNSSYQNIFIEGQNQKKNTSSQRLTDKSFQFRQHIENKQPKNNVQLPKISEPNIQDQQKIQQYSKLNQRSESLQHFVKHSNLSQVNNEIDYYFAEQEINQIFSHQIPPKRLDWASQPTNYMISHKKNTSQMIGYRDFFSQNISNRNQYSKMK